jgi:riboflavin synthase
MFTGIIEEIGTVTDVSSLGGGIRLCIYAPASSGELKVNDSIAVNGVCLTVVSKSTDEFCVEAVEETLKKTTLSYIAVGDQLNLELPLKYHERLHGHLVLGHVDTVGVITNVEVCETSTMFTVELPQEFQKYLIHVGSIAIDGISLTVARLHENKITVAIIPHTMEKTICKFYSVAKKVNIEFDVIGKYIEQLMQKQVTPPAKMMFSEQELKDLGY